MNKRSRRWQWCSRLVIAACALVLSGPVMGQGPATGTLLGVVRDGRASGLGQALVSVTDRESGVRRSTFTDRSGGFEVPNLAPGEYDLLVERVGFPPQRLRSVLVRPSRSSHAVVTLSADGGGTAVETSSGSSLRGGLPGTSQWIPSHALRDLPGLRGEVDEWAKLSTWADDRLALEGLPFHLSGFAIDGVPFRPARHPVLQGTAGSLLPVASLSSAEVVGNAFDVEWSSYAGPVISAFNRRGTAALSAQGRAAWSGKAISTSGVFDAESLQYQNLNANVVLRGSTLADSARFVVGVVARQWEMPVAAAWPVNDLTAQAASAGDAHNLGLARYRQPSVQSSDAVAGFGSLEWSVDDRHQLQLSVHAANAPGGGVSPETGVDASARDLLVRGALRSVINNRTRNTLNVSFSSSARESVALSALRNAAVVPLDLHFGGGTPARTEESTVRVVDAVELRQGNHDLKVGGEVEVTNYDHAYRRNGEGTFLFGGVSELRDARGVYTRTLGVAPSASWSSPRYALFAQDRWRDGRGIELVLGAKLERDKVDPGVRRDVEWYRLTGLANDSVSIGTWRLSPRAAVTWDVERQQQWMLHVAAGVYRDRVDPLVVSEWKLDDGSAETVQAIGSLGTQWTTAEPTATARARRVTLLGPAFRAPRTARVSGGVAHRLTTSTAVQFDAVLRDTRYLPRRADLNLLPSAGMQDGAGRGVFGNLLQQGGLLVAEPGSNRRFPSYGEVAALNVDGWSQYVGTTLTLQRAAPEGLSLLARYTFSQTRDNWFGAAAFDGWGVAPPRGLGENGDWTDGVSDFDLPHRAAVGVSLKAPLGLRVGALYRWQSGRPFTATYRSGVDANGDGYAGNDPAFIDPAVTGTSALLGSWSCLNKRVGQLAERNGCRAESTQTLDLQASWRVVRFGRGELAINAEVIDVFETDFLGADPALYLVDPSRSIVKDDVARTVTLPLTLNPDFGEPVAGPRYGRLLRIGAALTW